jgi:hypothetical protein
MEVAMRFLTCAVITGQLILVGALTAAAAQPVASAPQTQSAIGSDATANRGAYTLKAHGDMQDWQQKLRHFSDHARANGERAGNAAGSDLSAAWARTKEESRKLQTASAEDWASAKTSYEKASNDLADAWDRNRP